MFEIRIICDPADSDRVNAVLSEAFATGPVRQHPARDGQRTRLYITADHRPEPEPCPCTGRGVRARPQHHQRDRMDRPDGGRQAVLRRDRAGSSGSVRPRFWTASH